MTTNEDTTAPVVDWRAADKAYQAHHWGCTQCQASGKGYGSMCDEGQRLHDAYEAAPMPEFGFMHKRQKTALNQKTKAVATHV